MRYNPPSSNIIEVEDRLEEDNLDEFEVPSPTKQGQEQKSLLRNENPFALALQETKLHPAQKYTLPGYRILELSSRRWVVVPHVAASLSYYQAIIQKDGP